MTTIKEQYRRAFREWEEADKKQKELTGQPDGTSGWVVRALEATRNSIAKQRKAEDLRDRYFQSEEYQREQESRWSNTYHVPMTDK